MYDYNKDRAVFYWRQIQGTPTQIFGAVTLDPQLRLHDQNCIE